MPPHPAITPEPIPVRQASVLPMASLTAMDGGNADFAGAKIGLISPHDEHPCRSASTSPCRVCRGLSPPSHQLTTTVNRTAPVKALRAMPGAQTKNLSQS